MRSSKAKRFGKIGIKLIAFLLVCNIVSQGIGYFVLPALSYTRIQFHDLYETYGKDGENMDLAFIGTSHAYRTFDTEYFDSALNLNSYNFGTSQQTIEGSYYVLKEILKTNTPKQVVFELTYTCFWEKDYNPLKSVILYQYMKPSIDKLKFLIDGFPLEDIFYALVPAYTFREYLTADEISSKIKTKAGERYKNFDPAVTRHQSTEWMEEKGFVYTDLAFYNGWIGKTDPEPWTEEGMEEQKLEYLYKIIELCKENDVELIFMTAPMPKGSLLELGNYNEVNEYFTKLSESNGIDYYNFNLIRPEVLNLIDSDFYDATHVNGEGAQKVSAVFSQILKEREEGVLDYNKYFYPNFAEVQSNIVNVTNAFYDITEDETNYYLSAKAFTGNSAPIEFQYLEIKEGEENVILQDWSRNTEYVLPKEGVEGRRIVLCARIEGTNYGIDDVQAQKCVTEFPVDLEALAEE